MDFGELAKPATTLIEKVSDALGGIARPWQIVRVARAEGVAKRIEAQAQIDVSELQQRALRRFLSEEEHKQKNIEAITEKALPELSETSDPSKMNDDWITNFFDKCRIVSDGDMQVLWSKVLAGEANNPGSYSRRTVAILASLTKEEAELFTSFGSLLWRATTDAYYLLEGDTVNQFLHPFTSAESHLQNIGLVGATGYVSCSLSSLPQREFVYFDERYRFKFPAGYQKPMLEPIMPLTYLTGSGNELLKIAGVKKLTGYAEAVMKDWATEYKLEFERIPGAVM
jgi:hypothetical protein